MDANVVNLFCCFSFTGLQPRLPKNASDPLHSILEEGFLESVKKVSHNHKDSKQREQHLLGHCNDCFSVHGDIGIFFPRVLLKLTKVFDAIVGSIFYLWHGSLEEKPVLSPPYQVARCCGCILHLLARLPARPSRPCALGFNAVIVPERHRQGQQTSELSLLPPHFIARDFCFLSRHAYMWVGMPIKM